MHYSYEHKHQRKVGFKILFYSHDVMVKQQNYNKSYKIYERHTHTHTHTHIMLCLVITMMLLINKIVEDSSLPQYDGDIAIRSGEGHGNPLEYSGLENSWWATVHAVAKSRTRLKRLSIHYIHTDEPEIGH